MKLKIINSNSDGNAYILESAKEALLIECGVKFEEIKKAIGYNISKVVGCLITHEHRDHCGGLIGAFMAGIKVYATRGTHKAISIDAWNYNKRIVEEGKQFDVGGFKVVAFNVKHDAAQPIGFLIHHAECGTVLFLTDTVYSPYRFKGLNNVIIEANYCEHLLEKRFSDGKIEKFLRDRVIESHLSIQNCLELLDANDLSAVNNIVLIHLSDNHSDADNFQKQVQEFTGKQVHVADRGMELEFNKTAF